MVVIEVRQGTLGRWSFRGPAGNTGHGWSRLRSGSDHQEQEKKDEKEKKEEATNINI